MLQGQLKFVIAGHVDHGKSTLIGRLLYDTESLPLDKMEEVRKACGGLNKSVEFAYLLDHLEEERQQGITIDTTQVFFKTDKREYVIIDAPGHVEFVKNMITGASQAEAAVLIIDAAEGVKEQTKRHSYMLSMLGIRQLVVVLNKMDLVDYSKDRFEKIRDEIRQFLSSVGLEANCYIPISAISGENVATGTKNLSWYDGPTFLESLDGLQSASVSDNKWLMLPVQDIYKIGEKRINVGRIESGILKKGMQVMILPTCRITEIKSIEKFNEEKDEAVAGECIGFTTADSVFLDRGNVLCVSGKEPLLTDEIRANMFCMDSRGLKQDQKLALRCATQEVGCKIEKIETRINSSTLELMEENAAAIENLEVGQVIIHTKRPIAVKDFNDVPELGRFVLVQDDNICAGGIIGAQGCENART
jgi:sulfate adenylyltransferase large subunit